MKAFALPLCHGKCAAIRKAMPALVLVFLGGLLAGCGALSISNSSPKIDYFILQDLGLPAPSAAPAPPRSSRSTARPRAWSSSPRSPPRSRP
jgi:hypothetical protein